MEPKISSENENQEVLPKSTARRRLLGAFKFKTSSVARLAGLLIVGGVAATTLLLLRAAAVPTSTSTFNPVADTGVSEFKGDRNYGTNIHLASDDRSGYQKISYVKFTVAGLPDGASVTSAKLRFKAENTGDRTLEAHKVTSNDWDEATMTWNTKASFDEQVLSQVTHIDKGVYFELPVTGVTGNSTYSFAIKQASGGTATFFDSKDKSGGAPELVVEWQDSTAPSVTITSPQNGSTVSSTVNVKIDASDNSGAINKVELYVDGSYLNQDTASPYAIDWDTTKIDDGLHNLQAKAYDSSGNIGSSAIINTTVNNGSSQTRYFTDDSVWNTPVDQAPLYAQSQAVIDCFKDVGPDGCSTTSYYHLAGTESDGGWSHAFYWSVATDPLVSVNPRTDIQCPTWAVKPDHFPDVHIPATALTPLDKGNTDQEVNIFDESVNAVFAFWQTRKVDSNHWESCSWEIYYLDSNGLHYKVTQTGADPTKYCTAANFPWPGTSLGGCRGHRGVPGTVNGIRYDEVQSGTLNHAIKMTSNNTACTHYWPMQGDEDRVCGVAAIEGLRLRLKANVDCNSLYPNDLDERVICQTLKVYGAIIGDTSGGPAGSGLENCPTERAAGTSTCDWTGKLKSNSLSALTWDSFEVIQPCYPRSLSECPNPEP